MRPRSLWRHEVRRAGWAALLTPPVTAVLVAVIAIAQAASGAGTTDVARTLQSVLEMGMPLGAGIGAATLIGRDPVVELQLAVPSSYPVTLLRRWVATLSWVAAIALLTSAALVATGWWARWPQSHDVLLGQLTWLSPAVWLAAVGFLAAALLASPAAASGVVAIIWLFEQVLKDDIAAQHWSRLLFLFTTTRGAVPADWLPNRLLLLGTGLVVLAVAAARLRRTERFLVGVSG